MIYFAESEDMSDENLGLGSAWYYTCERAFRTADDWKQKKMKQSPCKGCLKRSAHPNCHITCDLYAEFVHYRQMYNADRRKKGLIYEYIKKKHEKKRR